MPVRFGEFRSLSSPETMVHLLQMLLTCITFSLVARDGPGNPYYTFAMFSWCFSFGASALIFLLEFTQLHSLVSFSWKNLPVTVATFSSLMTMASSITYPLFVVYEAQCEKAWVQIKCHRMLAASAFSCLASLAYCAEVYMSTGRAGEPGRYMATPPGILKVLQVFSACVIFMALSQLESDKVWVYWYCVGLVCVSLSLSLGVIITILGECRGRCPMPFNRLLVGTSAASLLMYLALATLWGLQLRENQSWECTSLKDVCQSELVSAIMIFLNLIWYTADFVFSIKLMRPWS
eukprot:gi/632943412/ref/XP_007886935.1/ PREDICTED: myeloid-associated differentiation marker homolog [Callorhinchus milii]